MQLWSSSGRLSREPSGLSLSLKSSQLSFCAAWRLTSANVCARAYQGCLHCAFSRLWVQASPKAKSRHSLGGRGKCCTSMWTLGGGFLGAHRLYWWGGRGALRLPGLVQPIAHVCPGWSVVENPTGQAARTSVDKRYTCHSRCLLWGQFKWATQCVAYNSHWIFLLWEERTCLKWVKICTWPSVWCAGWQWRCFHSFPVPPFQPKGQIPVALGQM